MSYKPRIDNPDIQRGLEEMDRIAEIRNNPPVPTPPTEDSFSVGLTRLFGESPDLLDPFRK